MLTPFQTVGPFGSLGLRDCLSAAADSAVGDRLTIRGRMFDGHGQGVPDGVLELWHPGWPDYVRILTSDDGSYVVSVPRPTAFASPDGVVHAPHIAVHVLGRGILTHYVTRIYFSDDPRNDADPVLALVPPDRRPTVVAARDGEGSYHFDVVLQGDRETVFFDA